MARGLHGLYVKPPNGNDKAWNKARSQRNGARWGIFAWGSKSMNKA